jgi:hypothetical protein
LFYGLDCRRRTWERNHITSTAETSTPSTMLLIMPAAPAPPPSWRRDRAVRGSVRGDSARPVGAPLVREFCLELTEGGLGGNPVLATVRLMDVMDAADLHLRQDLGVRPGESDPAGMLGGVLLLLVVIAPMAALTLMWWLV